MSRCYIKYMEKKRRRGRPPMPLEFTNSGAKKLARAAGNNRKAFAIGIGMSQGMIQHLIHGRRLPALSMAIMLEKVASVPIKSWYKKSGDKIARSNKMHSRQHAQ